MAFVPLIVLLDKHQELAEDLAHIATVDFVDDKEEVLVRLVGSPLAESDRKYRYFSSKPSSTGL